MSFVATASIILLLGTMANGVSADGHICSLEYYTTFDDSECTLLRSFDVEKATAINEAQGSCTTASTTHGESFKTDCNETSIHM